MKVRFFDPGLSYRKIKTEIDFEIQRVLNVGNLILREDVENFESNLAKFVGAKHAVGVNSGTDALFLSLKAAEIGFGDEVITSGHTFWATIEAIINCGAEPVLADIGESGLIDFMEIQRLSTEKTKAIIPVHLAGDVCNMERIKIFAESNNLIVIEDACQALGAVKPSGLTQCFSFYPAKLLGCYGDGGAVTTNDDKIAEQIKLLRNHGGKPLPMFSGFNSRLDNLQAAVLNVKFKYLGSAIKRRKEIAEFYDKELEDLPGLTLPRKREVYQDYIILVKNTFRDFLKNHLDRFEIETLKDEYSFPIPKPPKCLELESTGLRLPCNENLTNEEVEFVILKVREFFGFN